MSAFSIPTRCFSCGITAPMRNVQTGFQCQQRGCLRLYKSQFYKIQGESRNERRKRLAQQVTIIQAH